MAKQYDLYSNPDPDTRETYPLFVDVQAGLLDMLNSRVVLPLTEAKQGKELPKNLCPLFEINGRSYYLLTHQITTVSCSFLKTREGSLLLKRTDIINALDFLLSGI